MSGRVAEKVNRRGGIDARRRGLDGLGKERHGGGGRVIEGGC